MTITRSRATKDNIFEPRPPHILEKIKKTIRQETDVDNVKKTGARTHLFPFQILDYVPIPNVETFDKIGRLIENTLVWFILIMSCLLLYVVGFYAVIDLINHNYLFEISITYSIIWALVITILSNYL